MVFSGIEMLLSPDLQLEREVRACPAGAAGLVLLGMRPVYRRGAVSGTRGIPIHCPSFLFLSDRI